MSRLRKDNNKMAETQRNLSNSPYKLDLQERMNLKKWEKKQTEAKSQQQKIEGNNKKEWKQLQGQT